MPGIRLDCGDLGLRAWIVVAMAAWSGLSTPVAGEESELIQPGVVEVIEENGSDYFISQVRVPFHGGLTIEGLYDDNVFLASPGGERGDFFWEIVPELFFESSDPESEKRHYLILGYDPEVLRFMDFEELDAYSHRGYGGYHFTGARTKLEIDHRSAQFAGTQRETEGALFVGVDADVGTRTKGDRHLTEIDLEWDISGKSSLEITGNRFERNFDNELLADSEVWWGSAFLMREVSGKTALGIGYRAGSIYTEDSPDHLFQQPLARVLYRFSPKLGFDLTGGVDFRQYEGLLAADRRETPVFAAQLIWLPVDSTRISIDGFREILYSVSGDGIVRTGVRGALKQRFFGKVYYTLRGGYELREYEPSTRTEEVSREDDYVFLRNSLDLHVKDWATIGVFHEFRENDSTGGQDFERNQAGFRVSVEF